VATLRARLSAAAERPGQASVGGDVPRLESEVGLPMPEAPVLSVDARGLEVEGYAASGTSDAMTELEKRREAWRTLHGGGEPDGGWQLLLAAERDRPLTEVLPLVELLIAGSWKPMLVIEVPPFEPVASEPPEWLRSLIARMRSESTSPSEKAILLADASRRAVADCGDVADALRSIPAAAPSDKPALFASAIPPAVAACDCQLDVDALEAIFVFIMAGSDEQQRVLPLPISGGAAQSIVLKKADTVESLVASLAARPERETPFALRLE
jgi:hypothetical protein